MVVYGRLLRRFTCTHSGMLGYWRCTSICWTVINFYKRSATAEQAQQYYKTYYDNKHREVTFEVGDWVWIRLLHRPVTSLDVKGRGKLGPKFFGLYKILEQVGDVSYKLKLPP
jgi:hypothetical protein